MLCRHPPPAVGRDDDKMKIKETLDDVFLKLEYTCTTENTNSINWIICGPDNKIEQISSKVDGNGQHV